jgi:hypothetical protein
VQTNATGVHCLPAKQAKAIDVAKVGVCQQHIVNVGLVPKGHLLAKETGGFDQVIFLTISNAKGNREGCFTWGKASTAGAGAARLGPPSVLSQTEQGDFDHALASVGFNIKSSVNSLDVRIR